MVPLETLLEIERNCKSYAVNIPRQIVTERDWLGVGFRLANCNFVCKMEEISEVLRWPVMSEVPSAQPWFKGIANLRGKILPVTDLQGFVSGTSHIETNLSRVLVVNYENAFFGLAVEQVLGIEKFFGEEIKPADDVLPSKEYAAFVKGAFERDYQPWNIINFESIIQTPIFYHILATRNEVA